MSVIKHWIVLLALICQHKIFTLEVENVDVAEDKLQHLENDVFEQLIEPNDEPFEKEIKKLVAEYLVATAAEARTTIFGIPVRHLTRPFRRPSHTHTSHHHVSSQIRATPAPVAQPVYIQPVYVQPVYQLPAYQQPIYSPPYPPQYYPQPGYPPQAAPYPPQYAPYQPQPGYPPQTVPYQPPAQQQQPPASQILTASIDTPASDIHSESQPTNQQNTTVATPAPAQQPSAAGAAPPTPPSPPPTPVNTPQPQPIQVIYLPATTNIPILAPTSAPITIPTIPLSTPSPEHVYNQVHKILDNVGVLNVTGIVDQALAIRAPMPVRTFVTGILNTVFCTPWNRVLGRCRGY